MPQLTAYGSLAGWGHLWLKFVNGFDPSCHCQRCLIGWSMPALHTKLTPRVPVGLSPGATGTQRPYAHRPDNTRYDAIYLCGLYEPRDWSKNLHLVAVPDPDSIAEVRAATGTLFRIAGARKIEFPDLPLGYDGRSDGFTTCRNWRFGVAYYGLSPVRRAFDPLGQRGAVPRAPGSIRPAARDSIFYRRK